ncbi:TetR/AcrR family transcriptional regulator [Nocardia sp. N2S4-5]|uniref:TetR/AcrR family transcriptional regulator n=1 Tax=Nocardia sp. N2S4-5 TaxID=3351565 RepID=UPI0037D3B8D2
MAQYVNLSVVGSAAWWAERLTRQQAMHTRSLTMDAINQAACRILDRDGIDSLTMRRLATELDSRASSLYRHVTGREELLVHVTDHILGEISTPEQHTHWQQSIEQIAISLRQAMIRHPWITQAGIQSPLFGPNAMRLRELFWRPMDQAGYPPEVTVRTYYAVLHYTICSALLALTAFPPQYRDPQQRPSTDLDKLLTLLPADKYPTVVKLGGHALHPDLERDFLQGLRALIESFAASEA